MKGPDWSAFFANHETNVKTFGMGVIRGMRINFYRWDCSEWVLDHTKLEIAALIQEATPKAHAWVAEDPIARRVTFQRADF